MAVGVIGQTRSLLREKGRVVGSRDAVSNTVDKESLTEDMGSERGPKGNEGVGHVDLWEAVFWAEGEEVSAKALC